MKKNFRFDFKFLSRLKNKPSSSLEENSSDVLHQINDDAPPEIPEQILNRTPRPSFAQKFKAKFSEKSFLSIKPPIFEDSELTDLPAQQPSAAKKVRIKIPNISNLPKITKPKFNSPMDKLQKFNWNDFVTRVFSPYSRGKVHALFFILIIITTTYLAGKTFALFFSKSNTIVTRATPIITPAATANTTTQDISKIMTANLFNVKESEKSGNFSDAKKDIASIVCLEGDHPTSLSAKLMDTVILKDSVKSVASVQIRGGEELLNLREGEKIENNTEISKITRQKLILKNLQTGDCEYLLAETDDTFQAPPMKILTAKEGRKLFKSSNPNIKNVGNNFKIKKAYRETMMNNVSEILTQAKAIQITNPDGSLCFKMTEVVPGSLYTQLNIQENDIVCSINGKKIENLNELMGFLGKIREIDNMQIGLNRNGMNENLEYNFE